MEKQLRVKFQIGEILFEAEGLPEDVEHQRAKFMDTLLPAAVDAMIRTRGVVGEKYYIETQDMKTLPEGSFDTQAGAMAPNLGITNMSVNEFLNSKQFSSQIDTAIGLIYYKEKVKGCIGFSTEELKQYFKDAKITPPGNPSDVVLKLVGKSFIMESDEKNRYQLTRTGDRFVDTYVGKPKKDNRGKTNSKKCVRKLHLYIVP